MCRVEGNKGGREWDNCNSIINKIYFKKWQFTPPFFTDHMEAKRGEVTYPKSHN